MINARSDTITFIPSNKLKIEFLNADIPLENTVSQSIELISKSYNIDLNYKIIIHKNIPIGSGLGGGSSNAAHILKILNQLYSLNIQNSFLERI